jgi:hypothetical protein
LEIAYREYPATRFRETFAHRSASMAIGIRLQDGDDLAPSRGADYRGEISLDRPEINDHLRRIGTGPFGEDSLLHVKAPRWRPPRERV